MSLAAAVESLWTSINRAAGSDVTYLHGSVTLNLRAVPASTVVQLESIEGAYRSDKMQDFIVRAASMNGVTPSRGDIIEWQSRTWQVTHPGGGRHYEEMDQFGRLLRIHTKEIHGS